MSADIEAIRARLTAYNKYRWYFCPKPEGHEGCWCSDCVTATNAHHEYNGHSQEDIAALLAEVERLRARLTLTPEKVEAAAKAAHGRWVLFYEEDVPWEDERESVQKLYRSSQRAALLAAGMEAQP